jgi:hypothetical protein
VVRRFLLSVVVVTGLLWPGDARAANPCARLDSLLSREPEEDLAEIGPLEKTILDEGDRCLPVLERSLASRKTIRRLLAGYAMALLGGPRPVRLLRSEYLRRPTTNVRLLLCVAMGSTGSPEDIAFLRQKLLGEQIGDEWPSIEAAALTLGLLRATAAQQDLEAAAIREEDTIASHAAATAVRWLRKPKCQMPPTGGDDPQDLILTVVRCGVPRMDEAPEFYETEHRSKWSYQDGQWSRREMLAAADSALLPRLSFQTYVSRSGGRALVAISLTFGRINGKGYTYVARKRGDRLEGYLHSEHLDLLTVGAFDRP